MTGNKMIDTVIVGLCVLASAATAGIFVYTEMLFEKPTIDQQREIRRAKEQTLAVTRPESFKLDKLIINLHSRKTRLRFLDVQIYLVPFKSEYGDLLEAAKARINDSVIDIVSRMDPKELNSLAGKDILKNRIKNAVNVIVNKQAVKRINFSKFVVQ